MEEGHDVESVAETMRGNAERAALRRGELVTHAADHSEVTTRITFRWP